MTRTSLWWGIRALTPEPPPPPDTLPPAVDVLVVGGGLTGLATAALLVGKGREVAVVEARRLGAGTTGHSTAKVSLLQGAVLQRLHQHRTPEAVRHTCAPTARASGGCWMS